jgi:hypothetical protein
MASLAPFSVKLVVRADETPIGTFPRSATTPAQTFASILVSPSLPFELGL